MTGLRRGLLWMLGHRRRVRVVGSSMEPTLRAGSRVFVDTGAYRSASVRVGDIIHCRHPFKKSITLLKRVQAVDSGGVFLVGDNPACSTDSRTFGALSRRLILGRVDLP